MKHLRVKKRSRFLGISVAEMLVAISLTGVLAVVSIPKLIAVSTPRSESLTDSKLTNVVNDIQRAVSFETFPLDLNLLSLNLVYYRNGNFFIIKNEGGFSYFVKMDGVRITTSPELLLESSPLKEYSDSDLLSSDSSAWKDQLGGTSFYCANFPQAQCIYVDMNGKKLPNKIGKNGDIVPLRFNPTTGEVKTLYQWSLSSGAPTPCAYVSVYDVVNNVAEANACP